MSETHRHDPSAPHQHVFESPGMAAFAELEAEVLADLVTRATAVLSQACRRLGVEVRRVLDVGCGPGVGTGLLAQRFPSARVVAADGSAAMLEAVTARAQQLGLSERVETRQVELPAGLGTLGRADVAWASMVLHHVGDEVTALRGIRDLLEPGGLLAVIEPAGPVRVLAPDPDLGRPGLWDRLDAAWESWFTELAAGLRGATPSGPADHPARLKEAGFELVADEVLTLELAAPLDEQARRFAAGSLRRMRAQLESYASADDLAALDGLIDEHAAEGFMRRDDVGLRAARQLYVAARPG